MTARSMLATTDFWEQLMAIEGRLGIHGTAKPFELFGECHDELFALLLLHDFDKFPRIKAILPNWPDAEFWARNLGQVSPNDSLKEACAFWSALKQDFQRLTGKRVAESRVVDYGAGWGRIARFCSKDVRPQNLFCVEPNEELLFNARQCGVQCEFILSDWDSRAKLDIENADLVFAIGVMTHASPKLATEMFHRAAEITAPGGVLAVTVRPGAMLYADVGETTLLQQESVELARTDYLSGKHAFHAYEGQHDWGVAFPSSAWLSNAVRPNFEMLEERPFLQNWTHKIVYFVRT